MKKTNVIVIFGGQSTEHEISCRSAAHIFNFLDTSKFNVFAIAIKKNGDWLYQNVEKIKKTIDQTVPILEANNIDFNVAIAQNFNPQEIFLRPFQLSGQQDNTVIWPMLHGTNGEDGRLQGLLELAGLSFVGCSTLGAAIGMDKCIAKKLVQHAGVAVVPWVETTYEQFCENKNSCYQMIESTLPYPVYVKPANLGSSVGISKAKNKSELIAALDLAFTYDVKVLIEKGLEVREIECAALGGDIAKISTPGEIAAPQDSFYTYEAKYIDKDAATISVPAKLEEKKKVEAMDMCRKIYTALGLHGMSRIDLFLEKSTEKYYFNEVNTIPGFTNISQYPMLWKYEGYKPQQLLEELILIAAKRGQHYRNLKKNL